LSIFAYYFDITYFNFLEANSMHPLQETLITREVLNQLSYALLDAYIPEKVVANKKKVLLLAENGSIPSNEDPSKCILLCLKQNKLEVSWLEGEKKESFEISNAETINRIISQFKNKSCIERQEKELSSSPFSSLVRDCRDSLLEEKIDFNTSRFNNTTIPEFFKHFHNQPGFALTSYLSQLKDQLNEQGIKHYSLKIDKQNIKQLPIFPKEGLISLEVDLTSLDTNDLSTLSEIIKKYPIDSLTFKGKSHIEQTILLSFFDVLYRCPLITLSEETSPELQAKIHEISCRNFMIKLLNIKENPEKAIFEDIVQQYVLATNTSVMLTSFPCNYLEYQTTYTDYIYSLLKGSASDKVPELDLKNGDLNKKMADFQLKGSLKFFIKEMELFFFEKFLLHLDKVYHPEIKTFELDLNSTLTEKHLNILTTYLQSRTSLPFYKISLNVNAALIQEKSFELFIAELKKSSILHVKLNFPGEELQNPDLIKKITTRLPEVFKEDSPFSLEFRKITWDRRVAATELRPLQENFLTHFQKHNLNKLKSHTYQASSALSDDHSSSSTETADSDGALGMFAPKIKLKNLIHRKDPNIDYENYLSYEINHTEITEQEQQIQEIEQIIDTGVSLNQSLNQDLETYHDTLVDFETFKKNPYHSLYLGHIANSRSIFNSLDINNKQFEYLIKKEFFANVPYGIKYFTPNAALAMAKNLSAFMALNPTNLPEGFYLKKTSHGECVLDYDPDITFNKCNIFTPKTFPKNRFVSEISGAFSVTVEDFGIINPNLKETISSYRLRNLYIKFGLTGIKLFCDKLNFLHQKHPNFDVFLYNSYLNHLGQLDYLLENNDFFSALEMIAQFNESQLTCFKKFIEKTGSSQHDLYHTVSAFKVFWDEVALLCQQQNISIDKINTGWTTPSYGHPVVYMERLLTILKNTKNLAEQLECLEGIELDQFGAYYASKYEEFKLVSKEMALAYDAFQQNARPFNPKLPLYRVNLDDLYRQTAYHYGNSPDDIFNEKNNDPYTNYGICLAQDSRKKISDLEFTQLKQNGLTKPYTKNEAIPQGYQFYVKQVPDEKGNIEWRAFENPLPQATVIAHFYRFIANQNSLTLKDFSSAIDAYLSADYTDLLGPLMISILFISHPESCSNLYFFSEGESIRLLRDDEKIFELSDELERFKKIEILKPEETLPRPYKREVLYLRVEKNAQNEDVIKLYSEAPFVDEDGHYSDQKVRIISEPSRVDELLKIFNQKKLIDSEQESPLYNEVIRLCGYIQVEPKVIYLKENNKKKLVAYGYEKEILIKNSIPQKQDKTLLTLFKNVRIIKKEDPHFMQANALCGYRLTFLFKRLAFYQLFPNIDIGMIKLAIELYKNDIKFNEKQGAFIFRLLQRKEKSNKTATEEIKNLFQHLKENTYATCRLINVFLNITDYNIKYSLSYAFDAAAYWAKNPIIEVLKDDLLLFAGLLNNKYTKNTTDPDILKNMQSVGDYLVRIAQDPNSNLYYAFKRILHTEDFFKNSKGHNGFKIFLTAFDEIASLTAFDAQAVDKILKTQGFEIKTKLLDEKLFPKNNIDIKKDVISLIIFLKAIKGKDPASHHLSSSSQHSLPEPQLPKENLNVHHSTIMPLSKQAEETISTEQEPADNSDSSFDGKLFQIFQNNIMAYAELADELKLKEMAELNKMLSEELATSTALMNQAYQPVISFRIQKLKLDLMREAFKKLPSQPLSEILSQKIPQIIDFKANIDFEKLDFIITQTENLVSKFSSLMRGYYFIEIEKNFTALIEQQNFSHFTYDQWRTTLDLLSQLSQRNYMGILKKLLIPELIKKQKQYLFLLAEIEKLNNAGCPTKYIEHYITFYTKSFDTPLPFEKITAMVIGAFSKDNDDPILKFFFKEAVDGNTLLNLLNLTQNISNNRFAIAHLFSYLNEEQVNLNKQADNLLNKFSAALPTHSDFHQKILQIIARSYSVTQKSKLLSEQIDCVEITAQLTQFKQEEINALYTLFNTTTYDLSCLKSALTNKVPGKSFQEFINQFEKEPFGRRNIAEQFEISQVERVINQSQDLLHGTLYPFGFRKKEMEAFLFVNQAGYDLPLYNGKAAKDLTNAEIRALFQGIKARKEKNVYDKQRAKLYVLPLVREAIYRISGEFPNSTQISTLIKAIFLGRNLGQIPTGQGKTLIDTMKAAILWLHADRANIATLSLTDARVNIEKYFPLFELLQIDHKKAPIQANSDPKKDFCKKGINISTPSQFKLFRDQAKVLGVELDTPDTREALVLNEADQAILDEQVIYRYASNTLDLGVANDWIYYAVNRFINTEEFKKDNTSTLEDINALRLYLKREAKIQKKSAKIIDRFDNKRLLTWIESALLVKYQLRENFDYVLSPTHEAKMIRNETVMTHTVKILNKRTGKISDDTQFGNGLHPLLCAYLNQKEGYPIQSPKYFLFPESETIIASNNKNFLDDYLKKDSEVWGSSGTLGSKEELKEIREKYFFNLFGIESHQVSQVIYTPICILKNELEQFQELLSRINQSKQDDPENIDIVFCKDIETANRFFKFLESQYQNKNALQVFTGIGDDNEAIVKTGKAGMVTVTTNIFGRNTDFPCNRKKKMNVYQTYPGTERDSKQTQGRNGRRGSPGTRHQIYNQQDFKNLTTIEQVQLENNKALEKERKYNEELYDILYYFMSELDNLNDEAFVQESKLDLYHRDWPKFYKAVEFNYREAKANQHYNQATFITECIQKFHQIFKPFLSEEVANKITPENLRTKITPRFPLDFVPSVEDETVQISDCTPPEIIAYHFLDLANTKASSAQQDVISNELKNLWDKIKEGEEKQSNKAYLAYLSKNGLTLPDVKIAHQKLFDEFINTEVERYQNQGFFSCLLVQESALKKITHNRSFLALFQDCYQTQQSNPSENQLKTIKNAILLLMKDYLETNWFINSERRNEDLKVQRNIYTATSIDQIIQILSTSKMDTLQKDIAHNAHSFYGLFNRRNRFGNSRYQNYLSDALLLATTITGKQTNFMGSLSTTLMQLSKNNQRFQDCHSVQALKETAKSCEYTDKSNAEVILKDLEKALSQEEAIVSPKRLLP